jgi:fused signal recognition particle receptor
MAIWNTFGRKDKPPSAAPVTPPSSDTVVELPGEPGVDPMEPPESQEVAAPAAKKVGLFGRFKQALAKTYQVLNTDIRDLVGKEGRLVDDAFIEELFAHLVKTDMGNGPARKICDEIRSKYRARKLLMRDLVDSAKSTIREIMKQDSAELKMAASGPTVIMVCGVNGSGKTTSIAKLAHRFRTAGLSVVLGAGDTFRAAAVEQLTVWAQRLGVEIVTGKSGSDPASVAFRAVETAVNKNLDICIVDTAGRLQTQTNLMNELSKIRRVMSRVIPEAPHEVLLVLDATAGQNALSQARGFSDAAGCTGILLAKLDGTAKGGVAIPIRQIFNLPVKFIGLGETPDALAEFDVDRYVDALLDLED